MPDGNISVLDVENEIDYTIQVACECYCSLELVRDAVSQQPDFKGAIALATPCAPDPASLVEDADLVMIVADKASLPMAMERLSAYKQMKQATLLIYLQADEQPSSGDVPGLVIPRSELTAGMVRLVQALVVPVIPQGLICVDWADTRHILDIDGQAVVEEASGTQSEELMEKVLSRLQAHASGRLIQGMQVSILCSQNMLKMRHLHMLLSACEEVLAEDGTLIAAAPFLDWPDSDHFEIRLFAKLGSAQQREP